MRQTLAWLPSNHPQHPFPLPFYSTEPSCWRPNSGQSDGGRSLSNQPPHLLKQNKQTMLSVLGFLTQEIPIHVCAPLVQRAQGK